MFVHKSGQELAADIHQFCHRHSIAPTLLFKKARTHLELLDKWSSGKGIIKRSENRMRAYMTAYDQTGSFNKVDTTDLFHRRRRRASRTTEGTGFQKKTIIEPASITMTAKAASPSLCEERLNIVTTIVLKMTGSAEDKIKALTFILES